MKIIGIEGIDGSGKSVQARMLTDRLVKMGYRCAELNFPAYDSFFGKEIGAMLSGQQPVRADRVDSKSMALWYGIDRLMQMQKLDTEEYDFLILNRYTLANAVYQGVRYDGDKDAFAKWVFEMEHMTLGLPEPDIYFILDVDETVSVENNLKKRNRTYLNKPLDVYEESEDIIRDARRLYRETGEMYKGIKIINCMEGRVLKRPEDIHALLMLEIDDILKYKFLEGGTYGKRSFEKNGATQ